jgi:RNA polymerase subunit RPABC4/transcription elongation factor Spt4
MTTLQIIHGQLEEAAYKITDNFCYACYKVIEDDHCPTCGSDDFMRHLSGVGVESGTEWIIAHLIETKLDPVDGEEMFEELLDECYPEISIGCCTFSPSQVLKELDPVCFRIGIQEQLDSQAQDGQLYEHSGDYYRLEDIEDMIDELEA